jgi:hypothetical protein
MPIFKRMPSFINEEDKWLKLFSITKRKLKIVSSLNINKDSLLYKDYENIIAYNDFGFNDTNKVLSQIDTFNEKYKHTLTMKDLSLYGFLDQICNYDLNEDSSFFKDRENIINIFCGKSLNTDEILLLINKFIESYKEENKKAFSGSFIKQNVIHMDDSGVDPEDLFNDSDFEMLEAQKDLDEQFIDDDNKFINEVKENKSISKILDNMILDKFDEVKNSIKQNPNHNYYQNLMKSISQSGGNKAHILEKLKEIKEEQENEDSDEYQLSDDAKDLYLNIKKNLKINKLKDKYSNIRRLIEKHFKPNQIDAVIKVFTEECNKDDFDPEFITEEDILLLKKEIDNYKNMPGITVEFNKEFSNEDIKNWRKQADKEASEIKAQKELYKKAMDLGPKSIWASGKAVTFNGNNLSDIATTNNGSTLPNMTVTDNTGLYKNAKLVDALSGIEPLKIDNSKMYITALNSIFSNDSKVEMKKDIKEDFSNFLRKSSIRVASEQSINLISNLFVSVIEKKFDSETSKSFNLFLSSEAGKSFLSLIIGNMLRYVPQLKDHKNAKEFSEEFNVAGMAQLGNYLIDEHVIKFVMDMSSVLDTADKVRIESPVPHQISEEVDVDIEFEQTLKNEQV